MPVTAMPSAAVVTTASTLVEVVGGQRRVVADAVDAVRQPRVGEARPGRPLVRRRPVRRGRGPRPRRRRHADHDGAVVRDALDEEPDDVVARATGAVVDERHRLLGRRAVGLLPQRRSDPRQDRRRGRSRRSRVVAAAVGRGPPRPERLARRRRQVAGAGPRRGTRPRHAADRRPPAGQGPPADHRDEPVRDRARPSPHTASRRPSAKRSGGTLHGEVLALGRPSRWASTTLARRWTRTSGMSISTGHTS